MTVDELTLIASQIGAGIRQLAPFGIRYAVVLVRDNGAEGVQLGMSSNVSADALIQVLDAARASVDTNLERLRVSGDLGDVTPKGPPS